MAATTSKKSPRWLKETAQRQGLSHGRKPRSGRRSAAIVAGFVVVFLVLAAIAIAFFLAEPKDQATPERAAQKMVESIVSRDAKKWCGVIDPAVKRSIEANLKKSSEEELEKAGLTQPTCQEYFRATMGLIQQSNSIKLSKVSYRTLSQKGNAATVQIDAGDSKGAGAKNQKITIKLVKRGDKWYVKADKAVMPGS